jgi:glutathione S-transferase
MLATMPHTLYVIHGSHPCVTAERALQLKGQPYRVVEYPPGIHVPAQWLRFRQQTVPALVLGSGEEIVGSIAIVHRLEELVAQPPLLPDDADERALVEEAERWGDEVLQPLARATFWAGILARPDAIASYTEGSQRPVPAPIRKLLTPLISRVAAKRNRASAERARADVAKLPAHFDRVDRWIAEGVLGGEQPNAADLQICSSIRILGSMGDVQPLLAGRPCWERAQRVVPTYHGYMPTGALPA